ncbi:amino acid adenylation domain-containing protein [Micromonospora sp. NBC_01412]|uniref:amino acid adenylation domain-containing protein n=1 Tax=Micromonospora sp. NBC_01412 TaxID=2903590 RepID=UPI0032526A6D
MQVKPGDVSVDALSDAKRALLERLRGKAGVERPAPATRATPVTAATRPDPGRAPALPSQQRIWFVEQLVPGTSAYHIPFVLDVDGELDPELLGRGLTAVADRHEPLRTTFTFADGQLQQIVRDRVEITVAVQDLPADTAEAEIDRIAAEEIRRPFAIDRDVLVRARLIRRAGRRQVLVVTLHHLVGDGWSKGVLLRELAAWYEATEAGEAPQLPALPVSYGDHAWQVRQRGAVELPDYWRERFATAPEPLAGLPADRPRPAEQTLRGARHWFQIPADLYERLHTLSRRHHATPFMTLLAGFYALLYRYGGQSDLTIGTPVAGRERSELEALVGCFINTLVLRTEVDGDASFGDLIAAVRDTALGAFGDPDVTFEQLIDHVDPDQDLSRNALFQVMFVLENTPTPAMRIGRAELTVREVEHAAAQFDLMLYLLPSADGGLVGFFEYATDLFDAPTVARMSGHLLTLLDGAADAPQSPVSELPVLGADERTRLSAASVGPVRDYQAPQRLHELIEEQVRRTPDAPAVSAGSETLTYRELNGRANRLARVLRARGVWHESLVAVRMSRSIELSVTLLAVLKAGGAYLPLDPSYPQPRLAAIEAEARPDLVLRAGDIDQDELAAHPDDDLAPVGGGSAAAYVIYTSGSTGTPKGVVVEHAAIVNRLCWAQETYRLDGTDRVLQKTPIGFDVSVWELFWPLLSGAELIHAEPDGHRDPEYLARVIQQRGITTVHFVPSMLRAFLAVPDVSACGSLRRVICSGEELTTDLQRRCAELLDAELHNLYGPTEAAVDVSAWHCPPEPDGPSVPIGRPVANVQLYVLDTHRRPTPFGVPGELWIGGVQVARGYLHRPELTAERFVECAVPGLSGGRLYRTGDRARLRADGAVEFLGRTDRQVKIRGHRIELGEVEAALRTHPRVESAVAVIRGAAGGNTRLVGYLTAAGSPPPEPAELRQYLIERLPEAMVPAAFVLLDELPLGPNGKVDQAALPEADGSSLATDAERVAPSGPVEERLAALWRTVLGVQDIGARDNFFALGGDSILSVQVVMAAREAGLHLEPRHLFAHPTIAELAEVVGSAPAATPPAPTDPVDLLDDEARELAGRPGIAGVYPLLTVQEHMFEMFQAGDEPGIYDIQRVFPLEGDIDVELFALAWRDLVRRHPILRAAIAWEGLARPWLVVHGDNDAHIEVRDVRELDPAAREARITELFERHRRSRLDLTVPRPASVTLFRFGDRDYRFALTFNYMFLDGWSLAIVFRELVICYLARCGGEQAQLDEPPTLPEYLAAVRAGAPGDEESFWRRWLGGARMPTAIVGGAPGRPPRAGDAYPRQHRVFSVELTRALDELARQHHVTVNTLVQAAWGLLLSRYRGTSDVVFGVTSSGRPAGMPGVGLIAGPFINTLPTRLRIERGRALGDWLREVQVAQKEVLPYERTPQRVIRAALGLPSGSPLYDHYLVFQNLGALMDVGGTEQIRIVPTLPSFYTKTEVPLRIDVFPGEQLTLFMSYYERHLSANAVSVMLDDWTRVLERMVAEPQTTVAALADAVPVPSRRPARAESLLSRLTPVKRPRVRLVCFPHGGGNRMAYRPWAGQLPADVELCAVRLPGRDGRVDEPLLSHTVGMAAEIAEAIAHEDDGTPLVFFGHSMGAFVSLETTRALRWRGLAGPGHLVISGNRGPHFPRRQAPIRNLAKAEFFAHISGYGGTPPEVLQDEELLDLVLPVMRSDFNAVETYLCAPEPPLPIPMTVLSGDQDDITQEELHGWQRHTAFPMRLRMLPGDHFYLVPGQEQVLDEVRRALDLVAPVAGRRR